MLLKGVIIIPNDQGSFCNIAKEKVQYTTVVRKCRDFEFRKDISKALTNLAKPYKTLKNIEVPLKDRLTVFLDL